MFAQQILDHIHHEHVRAQLLGEHVDYKKFKWHDIILYYNGLLYVVDKSQNLRALS